MNVTRNTLRTALMVTFPVGVLIWLYGSIDFEQQRVADWDLKYYRAMAREAPGLSTSVQEPYVYRIAAPWLAGVLPLDFDTGFYVLTVIADFLLVWSFFFLMIAWGLNDREAMAAVLLFAMNKYAFGFSTWDFYQLADTLSHLCIVLTFLFVSLRRWLLLAGVLLVGALTRETALLGVVPGILTARRGRRADATAATVAAIPGLLLFLYLRISLIPQGGAGSGYYLKGLVDHLPYQLDAARLCRRYVNAFVPVVGILVVFYDSTLRYFMQRPYAVVYCLLVVASTFMGADAERLTAPLFVFVYPCAVLALRSRLKGRPLLWLPLFGAAFAASLHHFNARFPLPSKAVTVALTAGALLTTILYCWWIRRAFHVVPGETNVN